MVVSEKKKLKSIIAKKRILITGASGFIGNNLCQALNKKYQVVPKVLVHLSPIDNVRVREIKGDILNLASLKEAMKNVDVVVHCANNYDSDLNWRTSVLGTKNICEASLFCKVKKVIYLSSAAVYGYQLPPRVNEKSAYKKVKGDIYNQSKIEAEKIVRNYYQKKHLPMVIIQPTIVYGPGSIPWTIGPIIDIKNNNFFWVNESGGTANHIFISDLVKAILLAIAKDESLGNTFIISGGEVIKWKDFFKPYFSMLHHPIPEDLNSSSLRVKNALFPILHILKKIIHKSKISLLIPKRIKANLKQSYSQMENIRNFKQSTIVQQRFKYSSLFDIAKARRILGFKPKVSFKQGMTLTKKWFDKNKEAILNFEIY